jgi:hypothetical protein
VVERGVLSLVGGWVVGGIHAGRKEVEECIRDTWTVGIGRGLKKDFLWLAFS